GAEMSSARAGSRLSSGAAGRSSQSGISCAGAGPRWAPRSRRCSPSRSSGSGPPASRMPRTASTASASRPSSSGVPSPISRRPSLSRSRLAAARPRTGAGRDPRPSPSARRVTDSVLPATHESTAPEPRGDRTRHSGRLAVGRAGTCRLPDRDEVEPEPFGKAGPLDEVRGIRVELEPDAESYRVAVVHELRRWPALARDELAHRGADLLAEGAQDAVVVGPEDEDAHAVLEREPRELLGPVAHPARQGTDVEQTPDIAWVPSGRTGRLVDPRVPLAEVLRRAQVAERGQPTVRLLAHEPQHAGLVGAD